MDCIFCKIAKGEIPSYKIFENDKILAFLDIAPINAGHTLVVPKAHYANMEEMPEDELCDLMRAVKKIGQGVKSGLNVQGYNIIVNNDPVAGQLVPHLHFHIVPRSSDDGLSHWPQGQYEKSQAEAILNKIKSRLS